MPRSGSRVRVPSRALFNDWNRLDLQGISVFFMFSMVFPGRWGLSLGYVYTLVAAVLIDKRNMDMIAYRHDSRGALSAMVRGRFS